MDQSQSWQLGSKPGSNNNMKLETLENVADEQESSEIKCRKELNQKSRLSSRNNKQGSSEKIFEQEQFQLLDSQSEAGPLEETNARHQRIFTDISGSE